MNAGCGPSVAPVEFLAAAVQKACQPHGAPRDVSHVVPLKPLRQVSRRRCVQNPPTFSQLFAQARWPRSHRTRGRARVEQAHHGARGSCHSHSPMFRMLGLGVTCLGSGLATQERSSPVAMNATLLSWLNCSSLISLPKETDNVEQLRQWNLVLRIEPRGAGVGGGGCTGEQLAVVLTQCRHDAAQCRAVLGAERVAVLRRHGEVGPAAEATRPAACQCHGGRRGCIMRPPWHANYHVSPYLTACDASTAHARAVPRSCNRSWHSRKACTRGMH